MSGSGINSGLNVGLVPVKSKFEADILRFSLRSEKSIGYEQFKKLLAERHGFNSVSCFLIWYADPTDGDLLPINNDSNFEKALVVTRVLLRIFLQRKGETFEDMTKSGTLDKKKKKLNSLKLFAKHKFISPPKDFRKICAIVDADIVPKSCRRVRLMKQKSDKPLGFYIRDGVSCRMMASGVMENVPGVFISRVIPGGLAESTGLLSVGDEVLEVNGIDILDKSLDQVTDMMVANLSNLTITIKPYNDLFAISRGSSFSSTSVKSVSSKRYEQSEQSSVTETEEDDDLIKIYQV